jgi:type IV pilus assembly protein PilW
MQSRGFTIIEIMIALLLSSILLAGVVQIYASSKQSYRMTENVARMQENARFAMNYLTREIRMAGYSPCPRTTQVAVILTGGTTPALDFASEAIGGYEGGVDTLPADFPAAGSAAGDRIADSDAMIILRGDNSGYTLGDPPHNPVTAQFKVVDATGLEDGDILMVCDHNNTAIFQADNVTINGGVADDTVTHNSGGGGVSPGNCTKGLGYNDPILCTALGTSYPYDKDAQIVKFLSSIYYVGVSQSGVSRSLYRRSLLNNTAGTLGVGAAQELIDGIESMQLLYGVDTSADDLADRYVTADQVVDWNNVVSVRVALLVYTPEQINTEDDTNTYYLAGTQFDDTAHGNDKRLRQVYTSTVKIRNRGTL